jgi:hypothetical protein
MKEKRLWKVNFTSPADPAKNRRFAINSMAHVMASNIETALVAFCAAEPEATVWQINHVSICNLIEPEKKE